MAVKCIKGRASKHLWQALEGVLEDREIVEATITNGSTNNAQPEEPKPEPEPKNQSEHAPKTNGNAENSDDSEHPNHETERKEADTNETSSNKPNGASEPTADVKLNRHDDNYSRKVIGKDWAIQLLFDTLYLDEALLRKGANAGNSGITSLAGKVESAVGTEVCFLPTFYPNALQAYRITDNFIMQYSLASMKSYVED